MNMTITIQMQMTPEELGQVQTLVWGKLREQVAQSFDCSGEPAVAPRLDQPTNQPTEPAVCSGLVVQGWMPALDDMWVKLEAGEIGWKALSVVTKRDLAVGVLRLMGERGEPLMIDNFNLNKPRWMAKGASLQVGGLGSWTELTDQAKEPGWTPPHLMPHIEMKKAA